MARLDVQLLALFGSKLANVASVVHCGGEKVPMGRPPSL